MDTHIADEKLKDLQVEERTVRANDRTIERFEIDPVREKKLLWKVCNKSCRQAHARDTCSNDTQHLQLDLRVVPVLWFLFLLSFLDRTNIGNAAIQGMVEELDMEEGNSYNVALFIFFVPYILFEVPSNILLKKVAPSTWLSGLMLLWG